MTLGVDGTALVQESAPLRDGHITRVETLGGKYLYAINVYPAVGSFDLCPGGCVPDDDRRGARSRCVRDRRAEDRTSRRGRRLRRRRSLRRSSGSRRRRSSTSAASSTSSMTVTASTTSTT